MKINNSEDNATDGRVILTVPLIGNAHDALGRDGDTTIQDYLLGLLRRLWAEGGGFSGKRPFGDSGWEWDLIVCLVAVGLVEGVLDEDGLLESMTDDEESKARDLIKRAIDALGVVT